MEKLLVDLPHPYAWLNFDALDANIQFVQKACGDKKIRIATKSVRSVEILKYLQNKLSNVSGFMTYSAAETLYLAHCGLNHFLLGYPVYDKKNIKKLLDKQQEGMDVTFMVDHAQQVELLNNIAREMNTTVKLCIDINVSTNYRLLYFGTKRSPLSSHQTLDEFLRQLNAFSHCKVQGVMAYDAQIAGVTDMADGGIQQVRATLIRLLKKQSKPNVTKWRQHAVAHVKSMHSLAFVNGGGSGSMQYCSTQPDITEITVGSAFFAPKLFDYYESLQLQPAVGFALQVTRKFSSNVVVCHGGGYIASGAIGKDRLPAFLEPERFAYTELEGAGEVQTPIVIKRGTVEIGDSILFRHAKAGELCERFNVLQTIRNNAYLGPIHTYRGDGKCFL